MDLRLSEVLAALSHALDITEGQPRGHAARTCLIGMAIAGRLGLDDDARSSLFYALLLKDAGCSSNAAKVAALYGADDAGVKRDRRLTDHRSPAGSARHFLRSTGGGAGKLRHLGAITAFGISGSRALTHLRCERGADVARQVGLDEEAAQAIRHLDEHWDGGGHPEGLAGEEISLAGRILCLAQTAEVFWQDGGAEAACAVARERGGTWFDPRLVDELSALERDRSFWATLELADTAAVEPADRLLLADDERLDQIAWAFSTVIDAKSPYTGRHSAGVASIADGVAAGLGLDALARRELRRAALLHDIGKLGVSNRILDKPGKLTDAEWAVMRRHPVWSREVLERVAPLSRVATLAEQHHERLDGRGYPYGLSADRLDLSARVLAVADVAEALSAERPYRAALPADEVLAIMRRDAGTALDGDAFAALEVALPRLVTGTLAA
jgi:HD-GYP domain-containing protein (c-di-GMP phosphodiesterase class II)